MGIEDLAARGKVWAFKGLAEVPEDPLFAARLGETVLLTMINDSEWPHGMHLHGHLFRSVDSSGAAGPLRDTVRMDPDETLRIPPLRLRSRGRDAVHSSPTLSARRRD